MSKPIVAVLGGSGVVGPAILNALISSNYKDNFEFPIRIFTRNEESTKKKNPFLASNPELFEFYTNVDLVTGENLSKALKGTNIVIDTTAASLDHNKIVDAVAENLATVKIFVMSEFGNDTRGNALGPYEFFGEGKLKTRQYARGKGIKTVAFYNGLFSEFALTVPGLGGLVSDSKAICYTPDAEYATTSLRNVAQSVVAYVVNALKQPNLSDVPDDIFLKGDTITNKKVAQVYGNAIGKTLEIEEIPGSEIIKAAEQVKAKGLKNMDDFFTVLKAIFSQGYCNFDANDWPGKQEVEFETLEQVAKRMYN